LAGSESANPIGDHKGLRRIPPKAVLSRAHNKRRGLKSMSDYERNAAANRPSPDGRRCADIRKYLLATAVGVAMFAASSAVAQQASAPAGASPGSAGADAASIVELQPAPLTAANVITLADNSMATNAAPSSAASDEVLAQNTPAPAPAAAAAPPAPDLGDNFFERFWNWEKLEWGKPSAPSDPNAPPSNRAGWADAPQTTPPMPFTDWPYGGTTLIGDNRTASVDSPLMVALAPSGFGKWLAATGIQAYGWVDVGGNVSTSTTKLSNNVNNGAKGPVGGNSPAAYDYNPNSVELNQAVIYIERTPDTVQTDHIDWGFRFSAIYGSDYRYTTSYGLASYQLLNHNNQVGYDFPMVYGELYVPKVFDGLVVRVGRYISLPDIEAQLAPNNYMYSHSITYTFDNYTNEGIQATVAVNKNVMLQLGVSVGSETTLWNAGAMETNFLPGNPLYRGRTFLKDPGAVPSVTGCARFHTNSDHDNLYLCADAINSGTYGYNNLQWYGATYYHKFTDKFHVSVESYNLFERNVPNINNVNNVAGFPGGVPAIIAGGGTPFSPQYIPFNAPDAAQCKSHTALTCTANAYSFLTYWNYEPDPLDNISLRLEWYDDAEGQRTGFAAVYYDVGLGLQHWLSPQIELRPEITWYHASVPAFNDGTKTQQVVVSGDAIIHF
jgi:hypothetical protein